MDPHAPLIDRLRLMPRGVWVLCLGSFVNRFGTFVMPFLLLYMTSLGFSATRAGWAMAAYGLGRCGASLVGGWMADVLGRKRTIMLSTFSGGCMILWLSQVTTFEGFVGVAILTGITAEMFGPAGHALIADLVPSELRVTAFGCLRLAVNAGFTFGPAVAGWMVTRSFFWLFLGDALTTFAFGILAWTLLPEDHVRPRHESHWVDDYRIVIKDRSLWLLLAAISCTALVFFQTNSSFALHVKTAGFSPEVYGNLCAMNGLLILLFELPLTQLTQRSAPELIIGLGCFVTGLGYAINAFSSSLTCLVVSMAVFTLGEMLDAPYCAALAAELAPPHLRGRYMGMQSLGWTQAFMVAPVLGTELYQRDPRILWGCSLAAGTLSALFMIVLWRRRRSVASRGIRP